MSITDNTYVHLKTGVMVEMKPRSTRRHELDAKYAKDDDRRKELYEFIKEEYGRFFFCKYEDILNMTGGNTATAFRFLYLCTFADNNTYEIIENSRKIKQQVDFAKLFNVTTDTNRRFIEDLLNAELIYLNSKKNYAVSEYVFSSDLKNNEFRNNSSRTFINVIRELYNNSRPREHKTLGNIVKLLPFVNIKTNVLCWNIGETNGELIQLLTTEDVSKILYPASNRYGQIKIRELLKIKAKDEPLLIAVKSEDILQYYINPRLCYCGNNPDYLYALYKQFDIAKHQGPLGRPKRMEREVIK